MNLVGLVAVTGKPGLFKLIGQNKSGFILESLDEKKSKLVVNLSTSKLASLNDITIYGNDEDYRLKDIFANMDAFKGTVPAAKDDSKALRKFFLEVAPDHDEERVYTSDIKKILNWFLIIKDLPLFTEKDETEEAEEEAAPAPVEEVKEEKKPAAKKAKAADAEEEKPKKKETKTAAKKPAAKKKEA